MIRPISFRMSAQTCRSAFRLIGFTLACFLAPAVAHADCGGLGERGCCIGERQKTGALNPCEKDYVERGKCEDELGKSKCGCSNSGLLSSGVCRKKNTPIIAPTTFAVEQCVYNQSGYVAEVRWYREGTLKAKETKKDNKNAFALSASKAPFKTERIALGEKSCVGKKGSENWAVASVKGGEYARIAAIVATDIGVVGGTVGCFAGAAALTVLTAGVGGVAVGACTIAAELAFDVIVLSPEFMPPAKELFAVIRPHAEGGEKPHWAILYGTVFDPKVKIGRP
jgi:hypothetical protein